MLFVMLAHVQLVDVILFNHTVMSYQKGCSVLQCRADKLKLLAAVTNTV